MFQVGFAKVDITPELGLRLGGYGVETRPGESVHDRLAATAVVFLQGEMAMAHVTLDVGLINTEDVQRMRAAGAQASGLPAAHINLGVSHTHSAPQTFSLHGWGEKEAAYVDRLVAATADVLTQARAAARPAQLGVATTPTRVGINRRWVGPDNQPHMQANEHGPYDNTLTVLRFEGAEGPLGTIVHASAHCTAMGCNRLISRDWAGVLVDRMESQIHAPVLFINGAFGDVGPRMNLLLPPAGFGAGAGDGIHAVQEVGYLAAGDALRAWASIRTLDPAPRLGVITGDLALPLAPLPDLARAESERDAWAPQGHQWGTGICNHRYWQRVIDAHAQPQQTKLHWPQTLLAIGPVALVPMPGEAFSSISLRLRQHSPYAHTLVTGITNGSLAYLPDREGRARGGYEAWISTALLTQQLADDSDDALVGENLALLRSLHAQTHLPPAP